MLRCSLLSTLVLLPSLALAQDADHVLFVSFGGNYEGQGGHAFDEVQLVDPDAVFVRLPDNPGGVVAALAADDFDQIWTYDLSSAADTGYAADLAAIAAWYTEESGGHVIADGRFLGSFTNTRYLTEGRAVVGNYHHNLASRGGGLVVATDHNSYANGGTNVLASLIGMGNFIGNFGGYLPFDTESPLMTQPNTITVLSNDTSTGQAPVGTLPNGLVLTAVAYHSGNTLTPGISSTFASSFNLDASITSPDTGALLCPPDDTITATATAVSEGDTGPVTYEWYSSVDGLLGDGQSIELSAESLTPGEHEIRVVATDRFSADGDQITVQVGGDQCDDDGDGVLNGEDVCPGFDDTADRDSDGVPDACDPCFGVDNNNDADGDGVCDDIDYCSGDDAFGDSDDDRICDDIDQCIGDDATGDSDMDLYCDDVDVCEGDDGTGDSDEDGVCDDVDVCEGDDLQGDTDEDGVCDDLDACLGDDATGDTDEDGVCDDRDLCTGDDATGDADEDTFCADIDCIDDDPLAFPGADERCNGLDDDCDSVVPAVEDDIDGDGVRVCQDDCDDSAPTVYPGAPELCDTLDNNCDDAIDEGFADSNGDDVLDCLEEDADGDGYAPFEGDCDDTDASVYAGAPELCDGLDNDCDDVVPADEQDADEDGFLVCEGDCDDTRDTVYPDAPELCDTLDNDCDEAIDEDFADTNEDGTLDCLEEDADGDGYAPFEGDCDDTDAAISPAATELCDGVDTDCDGELPADESDRDADGFLECVDDCDDDDATVYPGAPELQDGLDNDCDGELGEDDMYLAGGCDCEHTGGGLPALPLLLTGMLAVRRRRRSA